MVQTMELEIRDRLSDYVDGRIGLRQFQEWFLPLAWQEASARPAGPLMDLISSVELRLAEFTNGDLTAEELKEAFSRLPYLTTLAHGAEGRPRTWTSSASSPTVSSIPG